MWKQKLPEEIMLDMLDTLKLCEPLYNFEAITLALLLKQWHK